MNVNSNRKVKQRNVRIHRFQLIRSDITLVLITNSSCISSELFYKNKENLNRLIEEKNCFIIHYKSILKCIKYFKENRSHKPAIVIYNINNKQISINNNDLIKLNQFQEIKSILLLSSLISKINLSKNIEKLEIYKNYSKMFIRLEELICEIKESDDNLFNRSYQQEKSLRNVEKDFGPFIWSHLYQVILMSMLHKSSKAKQEMLSQCRSYYRNNREELISIDKFERNYCSNDAIKWYTKSCFVYRIVNKALRTEDILAFYTFRYYIVDLSMRLKEKSISTRNNSNSSFHLYRGAKLSRNEIEQLNNGTLVATNGYLSTSLNLNVAKLFIGIDPLINNISLRHNQNNRQQSVLFDIDVNLIHSPEVILADVSEYSESPDENEFIFDLGTTFIIIDKTYSRNDCVWYIKMCLSSRMTQLTKDYSMYIEKRLNDTSALMMFGHLLIDVSSQYDSAMIYFFHLLQTLPMDDENRPTIYFYLGRIYRLIGQYENAIEYFRCALLLYKRRLPQSSIGYGRTLSGLATTYSDMGNSVRAIYLYEKAIDIHRTIFPPDHLEFVMQSNRLGYAYYQNKQYERAISHITTTISFYQRKMPENHPGQAQALHTMGLIQYALANQEKALFYYEQALHIRQLILANDHPFVAQTCYQISLLYEQQNDQHSMALNYAQRALNIFTRKLPKDHHELKQSIELVQRLLKNNNTQYSL